MNNPLFVNKKVWRGFTEEEMNKYQLNLFNHFRSSGFPYFPTNKEWRDKEYWKILKYDFRNCIDYESKIIKQTMHGLSLCWSYHPHHYEIRCNDNMTVMEAFNDDQILKGVIRKRIKFGDNMSDNGLRKMIKVYSGVQCVSNFRPTASASIYSLFTKQGDTVYDMSCGFGGRVLGAHLAGVKYVGVDPSKKTYEGLKQMIKDLKLKAKVYNQGSEVKTPIKKSSVDMCFTSPPYYDCEKYSNEISQSYIRYPSKEKWLKEYMKDTLVECLRVLKPEGVIVLNIQNVKTYKNLVEDVIKLAGWLGLDLVDEWKLALSNLQKGGYKYEPILVFKRRTN